jgi:cytochrome P450
MKENEEFIWALADRLIDEFADRGEMEFNDAYAKPFTLLVIADLLGVPTEDHETFRGWLGGQRGNVGDPEGRHVADQVFANLHPYFAEYIEKRRAAPGDDVMSRLANGRFADGELPEVMDIVRLATVFFAAGQETTARLLADAVLCGTRRRRGLRSNRGDRELRRGVPAPRGAQGLLPQRCAIRASPASSRQGPSSWR